MNFVKKVVVAVDLGKDLAVTLLKIKDMGFLKGAEVHFVHVFNTVNYSFMFGDFPLVYPVEADRKVLEDGVLNLLTSTSKEILPPDFQGVVINKCLFDNDPKSKFCDYVKETKPQLVIVAARLKHGLFESSFAQYVGRHTDANLLILKNEH